MNHDIDWFFTDGNRLFHVASNGGAIPDFIKVDRNHNIDVQNETTEMDIVTTDISVIDNPNGFDYSSFIDFAKKGFISIDKIDDGFDSQNYKVIAQPNSNNKKPGINELPVLEDKYRERFRIIGLNNEPLW